MYTFTEVVNGKYMEQLRKIQFFFRNIKDKWFHRLTHEEIELIKNTNLFANLDQQAFFELIASMYVVHYPAGNLIIKEDTIGDAAFLILSGSIRVFSFKSKKEKIALARLEKGDFFGEQALLPSSNKKRYANVEAITDTTLIKVEEKLFKKLLVNNRLMEQKLTEQGKKHLLSNIAKLVNIYKKIESYVGTNQNVKIYKKGEVIFNENNPADSVYIILSGSVNIAIHQDDEIQNVKISKGQMFGELGVIRQALRAGTATAREQTSLIVIPKSTFMKYYEENPQLQLFLNGLEKIYAIAHRGSASQIIGQINNQDLITTTYKLANERVVIAITGENNFFVMEEVDKHGEVFVYKEKKGAQVELKMNDGFIVAVKCSGLWDDLPNVCYAILDRIAIDKKIIQEFISFGKFKSHIPKKESIICPCLSIKKKEVEKLIQEGFDNFIQISKKTGASTVCGACRHRIFSLLGQKIWLRGMMKKIAEHNKNISSFSIELTIGAFNSFVPGAHIIIQAQIENNWIERAFTLSDVGEVRKNRVTIKNEGGAFTKWLFEQQDKPISVFCTQPQGNFKLNDSNHSIICFAGGIGITPFYPFAKSLIKNQPMRPIHIVYIDKDENDFIFLDDFEMLKKHLPNFKLTLWNTSESGYFTTREMINIIRDYSDADAYICGSEGFESSLVASLKEIHFREDKIHIERFTYAGIKPIKKPT